MAIPIITQIISSTDSQLELINPATNILSVTRTITIIIFSKSFRKLEGSSQYRFQSIEYIIFLGFL